MIPIKNAVFRVFYNSYYEDITVVERRIKMKLTKYDITKLGNVCYKKTKNDVILSEFINSNMDCAKVEGWTHKDAYSCASSLNKTIQLFNYNIKAITRNGEVFLIKMD